MNIEQLEAERVDTEKLVQQSAYKGMGHMPKMRMMAICLWASFLGAIPMLITWLLLLPEESTKHFSVGEASIGFFMCWLAGLIPTVIGVLLTQSVVRRAANRKIKKLTAAK